MRTRTPVPTYPLRSTPTGLTNTGPSQPGTLSGVQDKDQVLTPKGTPMKVAHLLAFVRFQHMGE